MDEKGPNQSQQEETVNIILVENSDSEGKT